MKKVLRTFTNASLITTIVIFQILMISTHANATSVTVNVDSQNWVIEMITGKPDDLLARLSVQPWYAVDPSTARGAHIFMQELSRQLLYKVDSAGEYWNAPSFLWFDSLEQNYGATDYISSYFGGMYFPSGWDGTGIMRGGNGTPGDEVFQGNVAGIWAVIRNPVPEPATMLLFGVGLLGLAGVNRRKTA